MKRTEDHLTEWLEIVIKKNKWSHEPNAISQLYPTKLDSIPLRNQLCHFLSGYCREVVETDEDKGRFVGL